MPKQNLTQYTVLGLLNMGPKTGYDIKQFVESTMSHFWNESFRWIYATLEQLDADGLATGRSDDRGQRERVVYRITKKGRLALQAWLAEPPRPLRLRDELLLKVLFGRATSARTTSKHIRQHQERMEQQHHHLTDLQRQLPSMDFDAPTRKHVALTLDLGRRVTAAHLKWCEDALSGVKTSTRSTQKKPRRTTAK